MRHPVRPMRPPRRGRPPPGPPAVESTMVSPEPWGQRRRIPLAGGVARNRLTGAASKANA